MDRRARIEQLRPAFADGTWIGIAVAAGCFVFGSALNLYASTNAHWYAFGQLLGSFVNSDVADHMPNSLHPAVLVAGLAVFVLLGAVSGGGLAVSLVALRIQGKSSSLIMGGFVWPMVLFFPTWMVLSRGVLPNPLANQPESVAFWSYVLFGVVSSLLLQPRLDVGGPGVPDHPSIRLLAATLGVVWVVALLFALTGGALRIGGIIALAIPMVAASGVLLMPARHSP